MINSVIITGADGFVGSYVTECFLRRGVNVLAVGRKETPQRLKARDLLKYIQADMFDISEIEKKMPDQAYDTIIHLAWDGSAGNKRKDYNLQIKNATASAELVSFARQIGCKRFIGAGSIMEYEVEVALESPENLMTENFYYSMGKLQSHIMCRIEAEKCGIDLIWGIITNAYGEGETSSRFINTTIRKMLQGEKLKFTSATQYYDFIYVKDLAEALYFITVQGKPFENYVLGSGKAKPLKDFIYQIQEVVSPKSILEFESVNSAGGVKLPYQIFSTENLMKDTDFRPSIEFKKGIEKTAKWIRQNL